jgi:hypothetical protein
MGDDAEVADKPGVHSKSALASLGNGRSAHRKQRSSN